MRGSTDTASFNGFSRDYTQCFRDHPRRRRFQTWSPDKTKMMTDAAAELNRLRQVLAASGDVAYDWDVASDAMVWFSGVGAAFGVSSIASIATGDGFSALVYPDDLLCRTEALSQRHKGAEDYECEYRVRSDSGEHRWFHERGSAEISASGKVVRVRGILRPLTLRNRSDAKLDHLANYDALTGHYNRARLRDALEHAIAYSQRYGVEGAYLVIGVDKMTMVNQAFGHEIADTVLLSVGERLDRAMRASDVIGRIGGDRFGAVLPNCPGPELARAAEKILDTARNTVIDTPAGPIHVTVSIGAVSFPSGSRTATDAMTKADIALDDAKRAGRDSFASYRCSEEQRRGHRASMVIAEQVQQALREDRMRFAYQPVVDARNRTAIYHECLIRMVQPDGEIVAAARFMPIVEQLGMIRPIDRLVLERAVAELTEKPRAQFAINVSALTTTDRAWLRSVGGLLRGKPDIASRLIIEITETAGLDDIDACARFVSTLRDLGCRVALDDFGAGYTSFRHLKQLAVNMVKIDGSFVRNIGTNQDNLVFVRSLIGLARNFELETVAECVETQDEAELLTGEGVDYLQGYAFGKPTLELQLPDTKPDKAARRSASDNRQDAKSAAH